MATINGTAKAETLKGFETDDTIFGFGESDSIYGGGGNDSLFGGDDKDQLYGEAGDDTLDGQADNDNLNGGPGNDIVYGGSGNDVLRSAGNEGTDFLDGGSGDDHLFLDRESSALAFVLAILNPTSQTLVDGTTIVSIERLTFEGGSGDDQVAGGNLEDFLKGGLGNDTLWGEGGNDDLDGGAGSNVLYGGGGNDKLNSNASDLLIDYLDGGAGRDLANLKRSDSALSFRINLTDPKKLQTLSDGTKLINVERLDFRGGNGNDSVVGGTLRDVLKAGGGRDTLFGAAGDDDIRGQDGDDYLRGGDGSDTLTGGNGADRVYGGAGHDTFIFETPLSAANADRIGDFSNRSWNNDVFHLDNAVMSKLGATGSLKAAYFRAGKAALDSNDCVIYDQGSGKLFYDANGSKAGGVTLIATLLNKPVLTATDFIVI